MTKKIEKRAMKYVIKYEKSQRRNPIDVSKTRCGYDIKSGKRYIEVKGQSSTKAEFIYLYKKTLMNLKDNILNYYIYIVYDLKNKPKLKILPPNKIFGNLEIEPLFLIRGKTFKGLEEIKL